ncbi:MAG: DUF2061 domain-containing protein [Bacteroidota bacterium]
MTLKIPHKHHTKGETKRRSMVKATTWRIIASLDTTVIAYFVTGGDIKQAISIGGFEVLTKFVIYFFHERAWIKIKWGKRVEDLPGVKTADTKRRSVAKATTWRVLGSLDTFILSKIFTNSYKHATAIAGIEIITKPVLYFLHERFWNNVIWGKREFEQVRHEEAN